MSTSSSFSAFSGSGDFLAAARAELAVASGDAVVDLDPTGTLGFSLLSLAATADDVFGIGDAAEDLGAGDCLALALALAVALLDSGGCGTVRNYLQENRDSDIAREKETARQRWKYNLAGVGSCLMYLKNEQAGASLGPCEAQ